MRHLIWHFACTLVCLQLAFSLRLPLSSSISTLSTDCPSASLAQTVSLPSSSNATPAQLGRALQKRMFRFSLENRLCLVRTDVLGIIIPVSIAAAELEQFYSGILHRISTVWSLTSPVSSIILTYGRLNMSMVSNNETMPWALAADLIQALLQDTRSYFTFAFYSYWQTEDHSVFLSIVFEILPAQVKQEDA